MKSVAMGAGLFWVVAILSMSSAAVADTYQYDDLDRLIQVDYENGTSVAYTYDPAGNITEVPEPGLIPMLIAGVSVLVVLDSRRRRRDRRPRNRNLASSGVAAAFAILALALPSVSNAQQRASVPGKSRNWMQAVDQRIKDAEYEVTYQQARLRKGGEAWQAPNRAQKFRTHFMDEGILVTPAKTARSRGSSGYRSRATAAEMKATRSRRVRRASTVER